MSSSQLAKRNQVRIKSTDQRIVKLGNPLPGYGGTNRRIQADNLFGLTYGEGQRRANESQKKVENYQSELLQKTATYKPTYKWAQN